MSHNLIPLKRCLIALLSLIPLLAFQVNGCEIRGTGDLGIVIERASGSIQVINTSQRESLGRIEGLGDLSHASAVFSRDGRYAYIFGRDGGLSKIDLLCNNIVKRVIQGGNSIGGAISQNGRWVAVSNYEPGGVRIFNSDSLELVADIPATALSKEKYSRTVGLVDAPGNRFIYSLFDTGETWVVEMDEEKPPTIQKFTDIGIQPYDGLITPDGRTYIAGLFGEDGLTLFDLWNLEKGATRILNHYGRGEQKLPVYKMPHLEGWAQAGARTFLPAVGRHELLVINTGSWDEVGRIAVHSQPVFAMSRPDGRQIWVNFAFPHNDTLQVIDTQSLEIIHQMQPGKGILHMEFTPRGEEVWVSIRDKNRIDIYNTETFEHIKSLPAETPSGIFFTHRAGQIGL
ncbi:MAG: protein nirF [Gammaproteobacteria bacterium]|nr:protein nirF [Gammaproteobacteria bacterium]MBT3488649.1 protein nirF [Gammaproteobacteria bacterium]MBT3719659.1 protein nirF [Gammaproteobacteria bacterium]MBT3844304.1 protein nirF [Gammaproteobacteria bacterium]MBT3891909.1 protein nirF [Gammaproteobacteria bacterium]